MHKDKTFKTALDVLVKRIAAAADRQGAPLTKAERGMLYFSESNPILDDQEEINRAFEASTTDEDFEHRIAELVRQIDAENSEDPRKLRAWNRALAKLSEDDFYLLAILGDHALSNDAQPPLNGFAPTLDTLSKRPPYDTWKLLLVSLAISLVLLGSAFFWDALRPHCVPWLAIQLDWLFTRERFLGFILLAYLLWMLRRGPRRFWLDFWS